MPLTRRNVTLASRVLLPIFPLFALGIGLSFTLTPTARLVTSPALRFANGLVPLEWWGVGFILVAVALGLALAAHNRKAYELGLIVMCVWLGLYAAVMLWSAIDGGASFSAWTWPAFVAVTCWAFTVSLEAREK